MAGFEEDKNSFRKKEEGSGKASSANLKEGKGMAAQMQFIIGDGGR